MKLIHFIKSKLADNDPDTVKAVIDSDWCITWLNCVWVINLMKQNTI